jgi:hypothetical protein
MNLKTQGNGDDRDAFEASSSHCLRRNSALAVSSVVIALARVDTRTIDARPTRAPTRARAKVRPWLRFQPYLAHRLDLDLATPAAHVAASHAVDIVELLLSFSQHPVRHPIAGKTKAAPVAPCPHLPLNTRPRGQFRILFPL